MVELMHNYFVTHLEAFTDDLMFTLQKEFGIESGDVGIEQSIKLSSQLSELSDTLMTILLYQLKNNS